MKSQVKKSYIICTTPRSGSNMLCSLLESSYLAGIPSEIFYDGNVPKLTELYQLEAGFESYFYGMMRSTTTDNGVFGFKLMHDQLSPLTQQLATLEGDVHLNSLEILQKFFPNVHFIHLIRRNKVQQAISLLKANQTNVWWLPTHEARDHAKGEPFYDVNKIYSCLEWLVKQETNWQGFFVTHNIKPHVVYYEDVKKDPQSAKSILDYAGISYPETMMLQTKTERQSAQMDKEWFVRYLYDRGYLTEEKRRFYIGD